MTPRDQRPSRNEGRDAILQAAVAQMSIRGPRGVRPNEICRDLSLSKSLVNFHFGGRDGLIAEAIALAYDTSVSQLWEKAMNAGPDALDRLIAWVQSDINWAIENPGLAAAMTFPTQAIDSDDAIEPQIRERIADAAKRKRESLDQLVNDAIRAAGKNPSDDQRLLVTGTIEWLTTGLSISSAGISNINDALSMKRNVDAAMPRLISSIKAQING